MILIGLRQLNFDWLGKIDIHRNCGVVVALNAIKLCLRHQAIAAFETYD